MVSIKGIQYNVTLSETIFTDACGGYGVNEHDRVHNPDGFVVILVMVICGVDHE